MNSLVAAVDTDLSETFPRTKADPLLVQIDAHREAISRHERDIVTAECDHDVRRRCLEADIEQLDRNYEIERRRLVRSLEREDAQHDQLVGARHTIIRGLRSALQIMEPNAAERAAPMENRLVPRRAVPVQRHTDIRS